MNRDLALRDHLALSLYWFALNFHWGALLTVAIPADVLRFAGDAEKGRALGWVFGAGAFVAMVAQPLFGAASDRSRFRWGRRRPFMVAGTLLNVAALLAMAYAPGFAAYIPAFLAVQASNNLSGAAYQGLIPDLVPAHQRGTASGFMGLMTMLGTVAGLGFAGVLAAGGRTVTLYWVVGVMLLAALALTLVLVREAPPGAPAPFSWRRFLGDFWLDPRRHPDFAWLFATRAVVLLGFYTLLNFLQYYLKDVLGRPDFVQATTIVGLMVMLGATASTLLAGWLSDRTDRRGIVFVAAALMGLTALVFLLTDSYAVVLAFAVVFGLGYGAFTSVDWALAVDVLPSAHAAAKDLGLWSISATLPQVFAPLLGGQILYRMSAADPPAAYGLLYGVACLYFLLGSAGVWRVRPTRPPARAAADARTGAP